MGILILGIFILGPFISILLIFISNFPFPFGILTPTLTSGINLLCLFNIIGASILSLNIALIFNGLLSIISSFLLLLSSIIFPPMLILGILFFGELISKLVSIFGIFKSPSLLEIFIFGSLIF